MSTEQQNQQPTEPTNEVTDQNIEATEQETGNDPVSKARREAASRRRELREAESDRDAAAEQLGTMRRGMIGDHLKQTEGFAPELLETVGYNADNFFNEDGTLNAESLDEAVNETCERYGILTGSRVKYVNLGGDGSESLGSTGNTWSDAIFSGLHGGNR